MGSNGTPIRSRGKTFSKAFRVCIITHSVVFHEPFKIHCVLTEYFCLFLICQFTLFSTCAIHMNNFSLASETKQTITRTIVAVLLANN